MGLFDELEQRCEEVAGKVGIPPEQVRSMSASLQSKLSEDGVGQMQALEAVAQEHGVPVDKVQEMLSHCGGGSDLASGVTNFVTGFLKR